MNLGNQSFLTMTVTANFLVRLQWMLLIVALTAGIAGCTSDQKKAPLDTSALQKDLESLSSARIFFGHQSVGRNLLQGLADIAQQSKVPLRIVPVDGKVIDTLPGLFHTNIGKNGDPLVKIEAFTQNMIQPVEPAFDIALMKFCYEDLSRERWKDSHALVDAYAKGIAAIRAAQPRLRLIHMTIPLRSDPLEWKTPFKRLLGRSTWEDADNQLRNAFNAELRKRFAGEAMFDIAEVESTLPHSKRSYFMNGAETVFTLAQKYTTDGGHLNEIGRQEAAVAFVRVVADVLKKG